MVSCTEAKLLAAAEAKSAGRFTATGAPAPDPSTPARIEAAGARTTSILLIIHGRLLSHSPGTFSFSGLLPERLNGRLAMLAITAAAGAELNGAGPVLSQLQEAPTAVLATVVLFWVASLAPILRARSPGIPFSSLPSPLFMPNSTRLHRRQTAATCILCFALKIRRGNGALLGDNVSAAQSGNSETGTTDASDMVLRSAGCKRAGAVHRR